MFAPRIPPPKLVTAETLLMVIGGLTESHLASLPSHEIDGVKRYDPVAAYDLMVGAKPAAPAAEERKVKNRRKPKSWEQAPDISPDFIEEGGKRYCNLKVAARITKLSATQMKLLARQDRLPHLRRKVRKAGSPSLYFLVEAVEDYAKNKCRKARGKQKCHVQSAARAAM